MKRIAAVGLMMVAGLAFAAKPKAAPKEAESQKARSSAVIEASKQLIISGLRDPDSARFRNVFISTKDGVVCGEVNSKNGMGGYVGFTPFMIEDQQVHFASDGPSFPGLIEMACIR